VIKIKLIEFMQEKNHGTQ